MEPFLPKKVIVKAFPVATTDDIEDFNKPILRKEPDSFYQCRDKWADGLHYFGATLALQNEGDTHAHKTNLVISGF